MKKELRPIDDNVACEICGRTILKGERTETFLAPDGQRHRVCDLCSQRADRNGWIREAAAAANVPARYPRPEPRRPRLGRLLRRSAPRAERTVPGALESDANGAELAAEEPVLGAGGGLPEGTSGDGAVPRPPDHEGPPARARRKEARRVRAVPTTAEVKVERALELFNGSEHQRTIAGLARTLGTPWISASPDPEAPSVVTVVVAWELSWYRFLVDLADATSPAALVGKGEELREIEEPLRAWNATIDAHGRLVAGLGSAQ